MKNGNKSIRQGNKGIFLSTRGKLIISTKHSGPVSVRGLSGKKIWGHSGRAPDILKINGRAKLINGSKPSFITLEVFSVRFRTQVIGHKPGTLLVVAKPLYAALAREAFTEIALNYYIG